MPAQSTHTSARDASRTDAHLLRLETSVSLTLLAVIVSFIAWVVIVFFTPVTAGAIHLLLALGATLLVRWWALRA